MRRKLAIIGCGGHAKVALDIFLKTSSYDISGFIACSLEGKGLWDVPIIGTDADIPNLRSKGVEALFVAIGDNKRRFEIFSEVFNRCGFEVPAAIHPTATISTGAAIQYGSLIAAGAVIGPDARIGEACIVNTCSSVDHDCIVEPFVHIGPGAHLAGRVHVKSGSFVGTGAALIPDVTIGQWSMIGAGSVVISDIPDKCTAVGVPAKVIKKCAHEDKK